MYKVEKKTSGYLLTFGGFITLDEMQRWHGEAKRALEDAEPPFGVIVDMRTLAPLDPETQKVMVDGQQLFKEKGMTRSAVVLNNAVTTSQFKRLAKESGIYAWERYINAEEISDWTNVAVAWVKDGVDPDKN